MKTSQTGISLIESEEGLRLETYNDIVGIATIGYGHKLLKNEEYPNGITQEEAQLMLQADLAHVESYINRLAPSANQNQFDALADFGYNLGVGALQQMLAHGFDQVPNQILSWDHAGGKVVAGLLRRRQAELNLWNTAVTV
jgi:lysozyme